MATKKSTAMLQNADTDSISTKAEKIKVKAMGITCEVDTDLLDDLDFFSDIKSLQDGDIAVFPRMLKTMFGESWSDIKGQLSDDGRVRVTKATEFFMAVFEELNAKNS